MSGKTVIVTGANTGIGKETARSLARSGAHVVITSRRRDRGEAAVAEIRATAGPSAKVDLCLLDLASFASIRTAASDLLARCRRIDVLVLNAGLILDTRKVTEDGLEQTFGINHVGHALWTSLLLPRIRENERSRIVVVSSHAHRQVKTLDFDDLQWVRRRYSAIPAYCESKLANILYARELARRLAGTGITVNALHPGVVATEFAGSEDVGGFVRFFLPLMHLFSLSPEVGARTSVHLASSPEVEGVSGAYFAKSRAVTPSPLALDDEAARRLWTETERLVGAPIA